MTPSFSRTQRLLLSGLELAVLTVCVLAPLRGVVAWSRQFPAPPRLATATARGGFDLPFGLPLAVWPLLGALALGVSGYLAWRGAGTQRDRLAQEIIYFVAVLCGWLAGVLVLAALSTVW